MDAELRLRFAAARAIALIGVLWTAAALGAGIVDGDVQLGTAPYRDEPQDTSGWVEAPARKRVQAIDSATARANVVQLYKTVYLPGDAVALSWNGSVATCDPGTTNVAHQQAVIDRVNYARTLVGLPAVTLSGNPATTQAQAASLIMSANNALSHFPPTSWRCYSADGVTGAGSSNLALGMFGVDAIDLYLDDPGSGNSAVGHRRWVLHPPRAGMATGDVPRNGVSNSPSNDLYVFGPTTTRPATPTGIAWPPAGYVPYQNLPAASNRWSFSYPGADFTSAAVAMTGPAGAIPVALEPLATGYGDNTIVFLPSGVSYARPAADTTYAITVSGIKGTGVPAGIAYTVTVIDPNAPAPSVASNFQGLWYKAPAESESGWGLNLAHQGDVIFATWFTYDTSGKAWWLSTTASRTADNTYTGTLIETRGPPFNAIPFEPEKVTRNTVGSATLTFGDAGNGTFAYVVSGVAQTKAITRQVFGTLSTCGYGAAPDFAAATNYQDLWWVAAGAEAGWGINLTHQGDDIFATWFTYDADGAPLWLSVTAAKRSAGVYSGELIRTAGPAFSAVPFDPKAVTRTSVGSATFTFANGNAATFAYTINGVAQVKTITRQLFVPPAGTLCR